MKSIVFFVFCIAVLSGCNETDKLKVINFADENYYSEEEVDETAKVDYLVSKVNWDKIENLYEDTKQTSKNFHAYLFVNETGGIDKIVIAKSLGSAVDNLVVGEMKKWDISPAKKEGKNVKSILEWFFTKEETGIVFAESSTNNYLPPPPPPPDFDESGFNIEVDEMPKPVGGIKEIQKNIVYPDLAKKTGTEGKVLVKVLIDEKGKVVATEVVKGIGAGCDQAAVDAVNSTEFIPGKTNGKNVKTQIMIPIMFKLR